MTLRYLQAAAASVALVSVVASASAQRRDGGLLPPQETGLVTVAGCLLRGSQINGGKADKYVLANPRKAPFTPTGETCTAEASADAVQLDNPERSKINDSMLGRWVEVTGRLEKETSTQPDTLRELDVEQARVLSKS